MFLDVLPKFLGQFSSWQRVGAYDFSQRFIRLNRFHERAVCFTFFRHNCGINTASRENKVLLATRENLICFGKALMAPDIVPKTVYWIGENINSLMQPLDKKAG